MHNTFADLSNAYGKNHFKIDKPLQIMLEYFENKKEDLNKIGEFVGNDLYEISDYIDKISKPKLITWSINGDRIDKAWINPFQRFALEKLIKDFEINRFPYKEDNWFKHYASIYLISDPGISCIITVTNQVAYAIYKYASEDLKQYLPHLIGDTDSIMYGATWFTEIQGGSDLGANITEAKYENKFWKITGYKYFASNAGLADLALVTAKKKGIEYGAKKIMLFLVPRINSNNKLNFTIRRLKEKSGTRSVPTGEVEFNESEAYLIGDEGKGIYYTMENLIVSRLANSVGALGIARKAYLEAYYYSQKRKAFGKYLIEHPLLQRDLLDMELLIEGSLALTFKAILEFQKCWKQTPPYKGQYHYARLLTHIAKNMTAEVASYVTKTSMEILGGIGFLEEFPIERLHREALITPIWEGTSNIHALDMLEAIEKKGTHINLLEDIKLLKNEIKENASFIGAVEDKIKDALISISKLDTRSVQFYSKDILSTIGHSMIVIMLAHIGTKLALKRYVELSRLYYERYLEGRYKSQINPEEFIHIEYP